MTLKFRTLFSLLCAVIAVSGLATPGGRLLQVLPPRMVVGTDVPCREQPNRSARVVRTHDVGDILFDAREARENGEVWVLDRSLSSSTCWVYGPITTDWDESNEVPALLVAADHILQRKDEVRFEEYVRVENLLNRPASKTTLLSSGLLQFRKLRIIEKAADALDRETYRTSPSVLEAAWVLNHQDVLGDDPFSSHWYMTAQAYWKLYESYKQAPWADELAWTAATHTVPTDECYSECALRHHIIDGPLQYWQRLPNGSFIKDALNLAASRAKFVAGMACEDWDRTKPGPYRGDYNAPVSLLDQVRASLANVTRTEKEQLHAYMDEAERKCRSTP